MTDPIKSRENYAQGGVRAAAVEKYEMLSKVHNQFTTRSNCFAVYAMIGYFEVKNPGPYNESNRPILGQEIGIDEGKVERHKFFAVIDRTNLAIEQNALVAPGQPTPAIKQGQPPVFFSYQPNVSLSEGPLFLATEDPQTQITPPPMGGVPVQVKIPATGQDAAGTRVFGQYDGTTWTIVPGVSQVVLDVGQRQEGPLLVQSVSYEATTNSATVTLQLSGTIQHDRGAILRLTNPDPSQRPSTPGHPGPQPGFNYKSQRYAPVVKYVEQLR